ncbi:MAG: Smr/MutS family protein [Treponema sp.]|jgi:DNA-nicking Smr family endonuclease|nr:Smr/MutS family protein [Treponema sp.]
MDFGKILDQWDKRSGQVYDKDADITDSSEESAAARRRRLLRKRPDDKIDLHGLTRDEAWDALTAFFNGARDRELEKLLVIHGKGNHLPESPGEETVVLRKMVRDFIERCPFAGESGYSEPAQGGTGSTWVLLKAKV